LAETINYSISVTIVWRMHRSWYWFWTSTDLFKPDRTQSDERLGSGPSAISHLPYQFDYQLP